MDVTVSSIISIVAGTVSSTAIVYMWKSAIRLEVLERLFEEKKTTIDTVKVTTEAMDKRISLLESTITDLKEVLPELRAIGSINTKIDALILTLTQMVPRTEHEARWANDERRFAALETEKSS